MLIHLKPGSQQKQIILYFFIDQIRYNYLVKKLLLLFIFFIILFTVILTVLKIYLSIDNQQKIFSPVRSTASNVDLPLEQAEYINPELNIQWDKKKPYQQLYYPFANDNKSEKQYDSIKISGELQEGTFTSQNNISAADLENKQILLSGKWHEDKSVLVASSPTGEVWGYSKPLDANHKLILMYDYSNLTLMKNGPANSQCPCQFKIGVFVSSPIDLSSYK